jgi:UDP-hydrolysing UDP-N-acetyl-D-glucosamine 2-epimerase
MSRPRRICAVTGSRADYGLLRCVMREILESAELHLQVVVTGSHLEPRHGLTVEAIEADGFAIDARVPLDMQGDGADDAAHAMATCLSGVSGVLAQLRPDVLLVLGDRFEVLAAAQAAMLHRVPIAHIAGGDTTEGAFDEAIRHAVTKMSAVHLVTHQSSAERVIQMGEDPARVHVVGSPGLDNLKHLSLLDHASLEASLGASLGERNVLVTFHPVTLHEDRGIAQFRVLLEAIDALPRGITKWITRPNADPGGEVLDLMIDRWSSGRDDVHVFASLGQLRYLSLMARVDAVVGNSSSGLYEAPSLGIPTVNVGDRQQGRLAASSVISCNATIPAVTNGIMRALSLDVSGVVNPYGDGNSAPRIAEILRSLPSRDVLLSKRFHEVRS